MGQNRIVNVQKVPKRQTEVLHQPGKIFLSKTGLRLAV